MFLEHKSTDKKSNTIAKYNFKFKNQMEEMFLGTQIYEI